MAPELTAARQAMMKTSYKLDVVLCQAGDIRKQVTGMRDQLRRMEIMLQKIVYSQRNTTEPALGRSTPEGNFKYPSTGFSVVATGWENPDEVCVKNDARFEDGTVVSKSEGVEFTIKEDLDCAVLEDFGIPSWLFELSLPTPDPIQEPTLVKQWPQSPKEYLSQPHSKYQHRQWNPNFSNERVHNFYKSLEPLEWNQQNETNLAVVNNPDEAKFDLAQLYVVGRADKRLRCTGLFWKLPPWPDFCTMNYDRIAQHSDYKVLVNSHSVKQYNHIPSVLDYTDKFKELVKIWPFVNEAASDTLEDTIKHVIDYSITRPVRKVIPIISGDYNELELKSVGTLVVNLMQARELTNKDADIQSVTVKIYDNDGIQEYELLVSGGTQQVVRVWDPGRSKNMRWHSSPLGVGGGLTFDVVLAAGRAQTLPKIHHCYFIRLTLEYCKFSSLDSYEFHACKFNNPKHRHYVILSKNIIAAYIIYGAILIRQPTEFSPLQFNVVYCSEGYTGNAIALFTKDWNETNPYGKYIYGWLAKEEDYKFGDLKTVVDLNDSLHMAKIEPQKTDKSVLRLVGKHKKEKEIALNKILQLGRQLDKKQKLELEMQQLKGRLLVVKNMEGEGVDVRKRTEESTAELNERIVEMEALNQAPPIELCDGDPGTLSVVDWNGFPDDITLESLSLRLLASSSDVEGLKAIKSSEIDKLSFRSHGFSQDGPVGSDEFMSLEKPTRPVLKLKSQDSNDPDQWVGIVHQQKSIKRKLMVGVEHFNRNEKKGFEYLQGVHLLSEKLDPHSVALFFRYTPDLDKNLLGNYLGNHDEFSIHVLQEFAKAFDFKEMNMDAALRLLLETFWLPGESQKLQRILEAFSEWYYEQSQLMFVNREAVMGLVSVIMLNTDQHNVRVMKKMNEEGSIMNNRRINGGDDLPKEFLSELYYSICRNEIRTIPEQEVGCSNMSYSRWVDLMWKSKRISSYIACDSYPSLDHDMFPIMAKPTVAAISVVFDNVEHVEVLTGCIDGSLSVATMAAFYHLDDVLHDLVVALCKFTTLLYTTYIDAPVTVLGEDFKARMATEVIFTIATTYGDHIRSGWRPIVECILRSLASKCMYQEIIDSKNFSSPLNQLKNRIWLTHWSLFIFCNHENGRKRIIDLIFQNRYLNAIQTNAHHLLRYLATAVVVNKRRRNMLKELIKAIQPEQHWYKDPITEFLECLYVHYDFDGAQKELLQCELVIWNDPFLGKHIEEGSFITVLMRDEYT